MMTTSEFLFGMTQLCMVADVDTRLALLSLLLEHHVEASMVHLGY